ncbi:MAG: hypothetical protein AB7V77_00115 [Candidatus Woesearchaeota archaeon]
MEDVENIINKYNLPNLTELYAEFGVFDPKEDEDFIKNVIEKLSDKVHNYIKFFEDIIQPDSTIVSMSESSIFENEERKEIVHILKKLIYYERLYLKININGTIQEKADYFNDYFQNWIELKTKIIPFVNKTIDLWKNDTDESKFEMYFG